MISLVAGAKDRQCDFLAGIAAEQIDRIAEIELFRGLSIDLDNLVIGQQPRPDSRRVFHRGDDDERALPLGNHDAQPAEAAVGVVLHALEILRLHELGMRVEAIEHSAHGRVGQFFVTDLLLVHVILADELEGAGEDRKV